MAIKTDTFKVVDCREKGFFIVSNLFVDLAGNLVGPYGCAVYNSLLKHADSEMKCWPSVRLMAQQWKTSKRQVLKALECLEKYNIISVIRGTGNHNTYQIRDPKAWNLPIKELTGNTVKPVVELTGNTAEPVDELTGNTVEPVPVTQCYPNNTQRINNTSPPTPPAIKIGKAKREKINIDYDTEIAKELGKLREDIQTAVTSFIDVAASENKTNTISQSRQWSLLCQLVGVSVATNDDVFKAALLESIDRKKPSVNYLKEIIKSKSQRQVFGFGKRDPSPPPTSRDNPPGEKRTRYAQNRDGTWTRTNTDGTESVITNDEMETIKKRRTEDSKDSAQTLITRLANAKAM